MNNTFLKEPWLKWAIEIQSIAQCGLTYTKDVYDKERYEQLRNIAAEMLSYKTEIPVNKIKNLFCNEKGYQFNADLIGRVVENIETTEIGYFSLDNLPNLSNEKSNFEQIEMCFKAKEDENWKVLFD